MGFTVCVIRKGSRSEERRYWGNRRLAEILTDNEFRDFIHGNLTAHTEGRSLALEGYVDGCPEIELRPCRKPVQGLELLSFE